MASLLFTPEWRDLCPSGLPPQILPQLQFTSVTWGGEFSVVSAEHVVRTLLSTNPHCDIFVASFFFFFGVIVLIMDGILSFLFAPSLIHLPELEP